MFRQYSYIFGPESNTQVVIKLSVIAMPLYNPTRPVASMRVFLAVLLLLIAHEGTYAKPKPKPEPKPEPKPKPFFPLMVNLDDNPFLLE